MGIYIIFVVRLCYILFFSINYSVNFFVINCNVLDLFVRRSNGKPTWCVSIIILFHLVISVIAVRVTLPMTIDMVILNLSWKLRRRCLDYWWFNQTKANQNVNICVSPLQRSSQRRLLSAPDYDRHCRQMPIRATTSRGLRKTAAKYFVHNVSQSINSSC